MDNIWLVYKRNTKAFNLLFTVLAFYTLIHILYSGVYFPIFRSGMTSYLHEFQNLRYLTDGSKGQISLHSHAHFGPTFYFLNYPLRNLTDKQLDYTVLIANYIFLILSFLICLKFFMPREKEKRLIFSTLFFILWFNFSPFYRVISWRSVEIFEFFLICAAFYSFQKERKILCGIFITLAALTKMLPLVFIFYLFLKDRKAFISSLISFLGILILATFVFGKDLGILYMPHLFSRAASGYDAGFFENNSLKGLVFRVFSGFHWSIESLGFMPDTNALGLAEIVSRLLQVSGILFLAFITFNKSKQADQDKTNMEFAFVSIVALALSPFSNDGYAALAFLAYVILFYYILSRPEIITRTAFFSFVLSYLFIGNFVPLTLVKYLPWQVLNRAFNNEVPNLGGSTFLFYYQAYGFVSLGYVLLFISLILVLKKSGYLRFHNFSLNFLRKSYK